MISCSWMNDINSGYIHTRDSLIFFLLTWYTSLKWIIEHKSDLVACLSVFVGIKYYMSYQTLGSVSVRTWPYFWGCETSRYILDWSEELIYTQHCTEYTYLIQKSHYCLGKRSIKTFKPNNRKVYLVMLTLVKSDHWPRLRSRQRCHYA